MAEEGYSDEEKCIHVNPTEGIVSSPEKKLNTFFNLSPVLVKHNPQNTITLYLHMS